MDLNAIPLLMFGIQVGIASIDENGVISLTVESPCQFGIETAQQLDAGNYNSLTITPTGMPVTPIPASEETTNE